MKNRRSFTRRRINVINKKSYYKRLEKGTFELPRYDSSVGSITLDYATLVMIVEGLSIKNIQKRKRYQPNF